MATGLSVAKALIKYTINEIQLENNILSTITKYEILPNHRHHQSDLQVRQLFFAKKVFGALKLCGEESRRRSPRDQSRSHGYLPRLSSPKLWLSKYEKYFW